MAGLEVPRRGIFHRANTRPESVVPVLPKPPTEPALTPESGKHPRGKDREKKLFTKTRLLLASLMVYAGGAVINEQFNNIFFSERSLVNDAVWPWNLGKSAVEDLLGLFNKEAPVITPSDVFDNNALGGTITSENTLALSSEEIKRTFPPIIIDPANNKSTILFPFQLPEGAMAQFTKTIVVPKDNPSGFSNQAEKVDILSGILPLGTKIVNPIEGAHIFLQKGDPKLREDPNLVKRAIFYWYNQTTDQLYTFSISPTILPGPMFKPIIQGNEYYNWDYNWENLPVANRGLELMETTQDSQPVVVNVTIRRGKTNSLDAIMKNLDDKTLSRGEVVFFVQDEKLVVLENQN